MHIAIVYRQIVHDTRVGKCAFVNMSHVQTTRQHCDCNNCAAFPARRLGLTLRGSRLMQHVYLTVWLGLVLFVVELFGSQLKVPKWCVSIVG